MIDEADIFLEQRTANDTYRNGHVSIFLRLLEYYTGILFLTTNRVKTIDTAFQSRIHVALRFGDLDDSLRKTIWKQFLDTINATKVNVDDEGLRSLSTYNLNGREIKNAIKTGESLARFRKTELRVDFWKKLYSSRMLSRLRSK